jgi:hypothetical protein
MQGHGTDMAGGSHAWREPMPLGQDDTLAAHVCTKSGSVAAETAPRTRGSFQPGVFAYPHCPAKGPVL